MYRLPFTQGVWQAGYETNLIPEGIITMGVIMSLYLKEHIKINGK